MNVYTISRGSACINMYAESQQQASTWCSQLRLSLCQICYPILNLADIERADCMEKIRKNHLFKHKIKYLMNMASKHLHDATEKCLENTEVEQMKCFAAHFGNGVYDDMMKIRNGLSEYLQKVGCPNAPVIARLETICVLLQFEVDCYDKVCDYMLRFTGNHMKELYGHFRVSGILGEWETLVNEYARRVPSDITINLNKCRFVGEALRSMHNHAFESNLIPDSIKQAEEDALEESV